MEKIVENIALIDAGNTSLKVVLFNGKSISSEQRFTARNFYEVKQYLTTNQIRHAIVASVLEDAVLAEIKEIAERVDIVDVHSSLFFNCEYATPETLGVDRLCNAAYAYSKMETEWSVVIDVGTCIKFDLVHRSRGYLGGSISPGIDLRYKALNAFTGKLPLINNKTESDHVGNTTSESIHSGVMNGMRCEIIGMIHEYERKYENLTFFVTGGDANRFDIHSKNNIFADEFLTLKGLYEIFKHNA